MELQKIMKLQKTTNSTSDSNLLNLLHCLRNYIQQHGAPGKPFELLRGLTDLTIRRVERGDNLKISSTALQVQVDGSSDADKSPGSKLATPWRTLTERTLIERDQGLQEFFSQQGHSQYLWPMKNKSSGGAGNASMYFLETRDIHSAQALDQRNHPRMICYISEITPRPTWWLAKLLEGGYALRGWRRWLLIGFGLTSFLIVVAFVLSIWLLLTYTNNISFQKVLSLVLSAAMVVWLGYSFLSPLFKLLDWRIIKAPDLLVSLKEYNVLIELVSEKHASVVPSKIIRLVRYAGTCPICSSKVEVVDGKKEFPNRFVGRCEENPSEHVYSFDRFTLQGKWLR